MTYVTSDLHGYPLEKFIDLLAKADFNENDRLYILGDVIDRGEDGIKTLLWMMKQPNVELILGNHESMMLSCEFICEYLYLPPKKKPFFEEELLLNWKANGGDPTIRGLEELRDDVAVMDIFDYIAYSPYFKRLIVNDMIYFLVHAGLANFGEEKRLTDYDKNDLLWCWPEKTDRYYDDIITVFGHTPTHYYGEEYRGKILKTDTWIDVDTGAGHGSNPSLLRLEDLEEFYL